MKYPLKLKLFLALIAALLAAFIWSTDKITLDGERTVYTVTCNHGAWDSNRCNGELDAGPRYRFRALKAHAEVLFWVSGSSEPSRKLTACVIQDGRNWKCPESADSAESITLAIAQGVPLRNPDWKVKPYRAVSKFTWVLLDLGWHLTDHAD